MPTPALPMTAPPVAPDRADRATFSARATASFDHLKAKAVPEIAAAMENVYGNAVEAAASAATATGAVNTATHQTELATAAALQTASDRTHTGQDAAATALDRAATAQDRAQTEMDRIAAAASAASASAVSGIPVIAGNSARLLRVKPDGSGLEWADPASVTLSGNLAPYATQTTTLTITNYDSATTYGATATGGTVSRSGDTITYVAGATAGAFAITVTAGSATRVVPINVQAATVAAPVITSPVAGATNIGQAPTITTGAFASIGLADTHLNSDWEIRTAASGAGTLIASSLADATNKLNWTMPGSLLAVSTTYFARVRHRGATLGAGAWSESSFTTAAAFAPTVPGTAYQGGFYAGRVVIGGNTYAIIVAPKSSGHSTSKTWKATADTTSGTLSLNDGLANSNAMNNANHPAAQFCRGLTIGGYTDWYLPSRDELEVCYRALKPTTTANTVYASRLANFGASGYNGVDAQGNGDNDNSSPAGAAYTTSDPAMTAASAFQSGGAECFESQYYLASTEFYASYAWGQAFSNGGQDYTNKTYAYYVRAVRKVLI